MINHQLNLNKRKIKRINRNKNQAETYDNSNKNFKFGTEEIKETPITNTHIIDARLKEVNEEKNIHVKAPNIEIHNEDILKIEPKNKTPPIVTEDTCAKVRINAESNYFENNYEQSNFLPNDLKTEQSIERRKKRKAKKKKAEILEPSIQTNLVDQNNEYYNLKPKEVDLPLDDDFENSQTINKCINQDVIKENVYEHNFFTRKEEEVYTPLNELKQEEIGLIPPTNIIIKNEDFTATVQDFNKQTKIEHDLELDEDQPYIEQMEIKSHKKRKKRKKTISSEKSHRSTDNYVDIKEVKIEQMEVLHAPSLIVNPLPEPEPNLEPLPEQDSIKIWDCVENRASINKIPDPVEDYSPSKEPVANKLHKKKSKRDKNTFSSVENRIKNELIEEEKIKHGLPVKVFKDKLPSKRNKPSSRTQQTPEKKSTPPKILILNSDFKKREQMLKKKTKDFNAFNLESAQLKDNCDSGSSNPSSFNTKNTGTKTLNQRISRKIGESNYGDSSEKRPLYQNNSNSRHLKSEVDCYNNSKQSYSVDRRSKQDKGHRNKDNTSIKETIDKCRYNKADFLATIFELNGAYDSIRKLIIAPLTRECGIIQLKITRIAAGLLQFYPKYILTVLMKTSSNDYIERDLLIGKKRTGNRTANYLISMDIKNPKSKGPAFLGKLRATSSKKDEYFLFGPGENPEKCKPGQEIRKSFMLVKFEDDKIEGIGKVKKTQCLLPKWKKEYTGNTETYDGVEDPHYLGISKDIHSIVNKHPVWSEKKQKYVYNFGNRVKESSNKNTQLVEDKRGVNTRETDTGEYDNDNEVSLIKENIVFQFGKYDKQVFNLDIQAPFSIFQAFGLCLSLYDTN